MQKQLIRSNNNRTENRTEAKTSEKNAVGKSVIAVFRIFFWKKQHETDCEFEWESG